MPQIEWSKLRAPLPWQHRVVNGSLVIPRAAQQDSGQYICNASSPVGSSEVFVTLDVESKNGTAGGWGAPGFLLPPPPWPSPILPLHVATSIATSTLTSSLSSWDPHHSIAALILLLSSSSQALSPILPVDVSTSLSHPCACPSPLLLSHPSICPFIMDPSSTAHPCQLKAISISAHISPSISFSWIHPSHSSQHTPIFLSPYSNIPFFLVDSPITYPSQLTFISPSLLTPLHLSIPCGFIIQHTPIAPSPYSFIHFVLVNSPICHPS